MVRGIGSSRLPSPAPGTIRPPDDPQPGIGRDTGLRSRLAMRVSNGGCTTFDRHGAS